MKRFVLLALSALILVHCANDHNDVVSTSSNSKIWFESVPTDRSGIHFSNDIQENSITNYLNFEYVFNGGGVAVGDINNDGLEDLYLTANQGENKLYLNKGNLKFEDITKSAGVGIADGWKFGANFIDINKDGYLDIYQCRAGWPKIEKSKRKNLLYINKGDNTFVEQSEYFGLDDDGFSIHSSFFDYDNDGDLDCYITSHPTRYDLSVEEKLKYEQRLPKENEDKFYENINGRFKELTHEKGLKNFTYGLGLVTSDLNNDGLIDIYVTSDFKVPDVMFMNQGDGTFKNEINDRLGHMSFFSMGVDVADINNDGYEDIFVSEMLPTDYVRSKTNMASMNVPEFDDMVGKGQGYQYMHNTLQLSRRGDYYSDISQFAGVNKSDWSWGCLMEDFDYDGKRDIYVANGYKRDYGNNDYTALVNEEASRNQKKMDLETMNSIFKSYKPQNAIFKGGNDYKFDNVSKSATDLPPTNSQAVAYADFDNDGDIDLIVNNQDEVATLLENKSTLGNYIQMELIPLSPGQQYNAKVEVHTAHEIFYYEHKQVRGYQTKNSDIISIGLGEINSIESIKVKWINGKTTVIKNVDINQKIKIHQKDMQEFVNESKSNIEISFDEVSQLNPPFQSQELVFDDYHKQVLLPHRYSKMGPFMSKGDVNGDGIEDVYIGAARGFKGKLYIARNGRYEESVQPVFEEGIYFENMGSCFFDADGDGDNDLYVVSGGNELEANNLAYCDRLYLNDGKGQFKKSENMIPYIPTSGSCVVPFDFDNDGDDDLFIGGRLVPDFYPVSPESILLINESGTFVNKAEEFGLRNIGMITSAVATDFDNDDDLDLMAVGEWTGIQVFENKEGRFEKSHNELESKTKGWWKTIKEVDLDGDGDSDYIVGNKGMNSKFKGTIKKPLYVYASDFDESGTYDVFLAKTVGEEDRLVPVRGKQCSSEQMPSISEKFGTYKDFALADLDDIIKIDDSKTQSYEVNQFGSLILKNTVNGLEPMLLPAEVQFSEVNGIVTADLNNDGLIDLILAGNNFDTEAETSKTDASIGTILINKGDFRFDVLPDGHSNLDLRGNVKDLMIIENNLFVSINLEELNTYKITN